MSVAAHRFNNDLRYRDAQHPDNTQFTPGYVLDLVRDDLDIIDLDPCTTKDNPVGANRFYTPEDDGLKQSWLWTSSIFVNPPYAKAREPWVHLCMVHGALGIPVVLLIPAATDTRVFQRAAASASAIVFVRGRLKFGTLRPNRRQIAASHPSALIAWNCGLAACSALGWSTSTTAALPPPKSCPSDPPLHT